MNYPDRDPALNVRLVSDPVNSSTARDVLAEEAAEFLATHSAAQDGSDPRGGHHHV
jgi:hypothetical protein